MKSPHWALRLLAVLLPPACSAVLAAEAGTIRGRFLLHGEVSEVRPLTVDKDVEVCGRCDIPSESIVVGADKGIANVLVYIRDNAIPLPPGDTPRPTVISIDGCRFKPHVAVVRAGQDLILRNTDPVEHTALVWTIENPSSPVTIRPGKDYIHTFQNPERVPLRFDSRSHLWMSGYLLVHPNPYACVSNEKGEFEIAKIPPGKWELQFWHEKAGYINEMAIAGDLQMIPKGRMEISVDRDIKDFGDIVLDVAKLTGEKAEPGVGADSR